MWCEFVPAAILEQYKIIFTIILMRRRWWSVCVCVCVCVCVWERERERDTWTIQRSSSSSFWWQQWWWCRSIINKRMATALLEQYKDHLCIILMMTIMMVSFNTKQVYGYCHTWTIQGSSSHHLDDDNDVIQ